MNLQTSKVLQFDYSIIGCLIFLNEKQVSDIINNLIVNCSRLFIGIENLKFDL